MNHDSSAPMAPNFSINPAAGGTTPAESPRWALARRGSHIRSAGKRRLIPFLGQEAYDSRV